MTLKRLTMKAAMMTMATVMTMTLAASMALTACSSDDDNKSSDPTETEEDAAEVAQIREQLEADLMLKALCDYDSVTGRYTPRIGEAIEAPTPTIYYTIANTVEQARSRYEGIVAAVRSDEAKADDDAADTGADKPDIVDDEPLPTDVRRGDVHVTFAESSSDGEVARITVDCPRLAGVLTSIVFIPETAWPTNDTAAPFNHLSCWREKSTGRIYVCVQDCRGGRGIMLTFDGGWGEDWFRQYDHWQGQFYLWCNVASRDAFKGLEDAWYYNRDKLNNMNNALQSKYPNTTTAQNIKEFINGNRINYDLDYSYDHHLWWGYNCWDIQQNKMSFWQHRVSEYGYFCTHKAVPDRDAPSHEFGFDRGYNRKDTEWEAIYR